MYGCHDTGVLSAFMCACSIHLNIMSTHTLINSFLSPFVYFIIADILERSSPKMLKTIQNNGNNSANNNNEYSSCLCGVKNVNMYNDAQFKQIPDQCKTDHNANLPNLLLTSKHDLESSNSTANMHLHTIAKNSSGRWSRMIKPVFSSFILGLVVYVRPDTCAVILSVIAFTINLKRLKFILCPFYLIGFILAISIGLRDDYVSYGSVIISPWQWIKFNVGGNLSSKLFGVEPTLFYVRRLLLDDWLNFLLLTFITFVFLSYAVYTVILPHGNSSPKVMLEVKMTKQLISIVLCLLCLYSSKGHKEIRFVHDVIPLILILYSKIILVVCELGSKFCKIKQCVYLILILTASFQWNTFISLDKSKISQWSYRGIDNSNHVNKCLDFISRQQNVTGVFLDADFHMSGGFSILRHNVSVLALNQKEYFKFGEDSRIIVNSNFISNGNNSILTLSRISDFISANNQRYLWKSIIGDSSINYLIVAVPNF
ncbi:PIGB [Mytilus edulis]|uniref:Mannosyltransferase n=1 Tax=Mytilus edulis TaxID=6550 RepID=A0A8S3Q221_MYTED|nr:PIGB [Mytilus edulis]